MAMVEVLPAAPSKSEPVAATKPLFTRPAGYVPYVPPPIPDAVPATVLEVVVPEEPEPLLDTQLSWWASWCRDRARNKLQRTLARVIQIRQDHESNGVPSGDPIYQHLYAKALELCHGYFDEWHLNRDNIEIEIPCMRQLHLAAHPEATISARKLPVAILGLVAIVALPLIVGAWCGLFGVGHHWIMHLFGG
jgi:hypothetical protein